MSNDSFSPRWWEDHYQGQPVKHGAPSPQLVAEVSELPAGTALDAGCGSGADALWLAERGWRVTAVDVSPTVIGAARERGPDVTWIVADLTTWPPPERYDLVTTQYVHPAMPFGDFVARLAGAVAPGGTLLVVGHDHGDEHSAAHAPAEASIGLAPIIGGLSPQRWDVTVAEPRTRHSEHRTVIRDLVVKARRK
jgi:trans-aconitate methyltransferase